MELGALLPITDDLVAKLLSLKDIETFFLRGFKDSPEQINKPEFTVSDVNYCIDIIEKAFVDDLVNTERELILQLAKANTPSRVTLLNVLNKSVRMVETSLAPGNTKAFRSEINKHIPSSPFDKKIDDMARLQHGLRIRELAFSFSCIGDKYIMEYEDQIEEDNTLSIVNGKKPKAIPNLKNYIQPKILEELCLKLEEAAWIKKDLGGQITWQCNETEKIIPNEYDKRLSSIRIKTISVREMPLIALSYLIKERNWMFLPDKKFDKIRPMAIAFLNFFGLLPSDKVEINHKVRYFYSDVVGDVELYSKNFDYIDDLKQYQQV